MRFLDNEEITNWSKSFQKLNLNNNSHWSPLNYDCKDSNFLEGIISFGDKYFQFLPTQKKSTISIFTDDFNYRPKINYNFSFSVSKSKLDLFNSILDKFLSEGFQFFLNLNLVKLERYHFSVLDKKSENTIRIRDLKIEKFADFLNYSEHRIYEQDFVRFSYQFRKTDLYELIGFVTCLRDAIDYVSNWIYDDEGNELSIPKVGEIVSLKSDKSSDYLIVSFRYLRKNLLDTDVYGWSKMQFKNSTFIFELVKIKNTNKDVIIYENESSFVYLEDIVNSRNILISNLLRKN